ncbi:MAG: MBOAT family O-acyltransferase [Bacteroidales bacterium]|jgi:D-alanyl-lipoteichoic acid acyltransferase DltB (MBOAT superfamily)
MSFIPKYIFILGTTITVDYIAGRYIEKVEGSKKRLYLIISIICNVGFLAFYKYFNFINENISDLANFLNWNYPIKAFEIILPIGLSFHTFQAMSYTIEVYRGNQKAEKHFGIYALYVMFYPQLVAGPIERPQNLIRQFYEKHHFDYKNVTDGLKLMLWGFFKKMVIADRLASYVNEVYNHPDLYHGTPVILATVFFAIQIFCDFSAYSDIAIGAAKVMGFRLMLNFNTPYFSKTIKEFWTRWHISLSSWLRDYLFVPLSMYYRNGKVYGVCLAILITFSISGLWHGAKWTFVIWGVIHGLYLALSIVLSKLKKRINKFFKINTDFFLIKIFDVSIVFILVCFTWIFFRSDSVSTAFKLIGNSVNFSNGLLNYDVLGGKTDLFITVLMIMLMEIIHLMQRKSSVIKIINSYSKFVRWLVYCLFVWLILIFGQFGNQQFIYFQF